METNDFTSHTGNTGARRHDTQKPISQHQAERPITSVKITKIQGIWYVRIDYGLADLCGHFTTKDYPSFEAAILAVVEAKDREEGIVR
jgi:hypothetical protein